MLYAVIVACEVLFWVAVAAGLTARYPLRRPRVGTALLATAPLVDLVLLVVTVLDLRRGGAASAAHALAAVYIGVSVGFGHHLVGWADARFAHRFAGGPPPPPRPRSGPARAAAERRGFVRHLVAYAVGAGLLGIATAAIGEPTRTQSLTGAVALWTLILVVDGAVSLSYSVRPRAGPSVRDPG